MGRSFGFFASVFVWAAVAVNSATPAEPGTSRGALRSIGSGVWGAVFSPRADQVAVFSPNGFQVFDVSTGNQLMAFAGRWGNINGAAWSPDGKRIAAAFGTWIDAVIPPLDTTARILDVATGREITCYIGHTAPVLDVQFSPDGNRLFTDSADNSARIWDVVCGRQLVALKCELSPWRWPVASLSRDGRFVLAVRADFRASAAVWSAETGRLVCKIRPPMPKGVVPGAAGAPSFMSARFSPDGTRVVTAGPGPLVQIWDASTGRELKSLIGHTDAANVAAYSADGARVATASDDGTARLWDGRTGREIRRFVHPGPVSDVALSADGRRMHTRWQQRDVRGAPSWDAAIRDSLWDVNTGAETRVPRYGRVLGFGPDSDLYLIIEREASFKPHEKFDPSRNGTTLYDTATGKAIRTYR